MEKLNLWCKLIACVSIVTSVFSLVLPESRQKKSFKTTMSIILLFAFVYPLSEKADFTVELNKSIINTHGESLDEKAAEYGNLPLIYAAETETRKYLEEILADIGIICECEVDCSFTDESITIDRVIINGNISNNDRQIIISRISELANNETEVILNGEYYDFSK